MKAVVRLGVLITLISVLMFGNVGAVVTGTEEGESIVDDGDDLDFDFASGLAVAKGTGDFGWAPTNTVVPGTGVMIIDQGDGYMDDFPYLNMSGTPLGSFTPDTYHVYGVLTPEGKFAKLHFPDLYGTPTNDTIQWEYQPNGNNWFGVGVGESSTGEYCNNYADDNSNSLTDCDDPQCYTLSLCGEGGGGGSCDDGSDNDGDSFVDCADDQCNLAPTCSGFGFDPHEFGCMELNATECVNATYDANCTWDPFSHDNAGACIIDCFQYNDNAGGNRTSCEEAFGGNSSFHICEWKFADPSSPSNFSGKCDPSFFDKSFDGASPCFEYNGNETGCANLKDHTDTSMCIWSSDPGNGPAPDYGWCDPKGFYNYDESFDCWEYEGNKTGCLYAKQTLGWSCEWSPDPWAPIVQGDEAGWCQSFSGGGGGGGGANFDCYSNMEQSTCDDAASLGQPCTWKTDTSSGCMPKGCWDYWNETSCNANKEVGCEWDSTYNYCEEKWCWDLSTADSCNAADANYNLSCAWYEDPWDSTKGKCEEIGCGFYNYNQTACAAQGGCTWSSPYCNPKGCGDFSDNPTNCVDKSLHGLDCQYQTDSMGWCEQAGCWSYDYNQTGCEELNASQNGITCVWDAPYCYEEYNAFSCSDYNDQMKNCFDTGWCFWNASGSKCQEPDMGFIKTFQNPGCWIFDQPGEQKCNNVTTCLWGGSTCGDKGAGPGQNGIQCSQINNSQMCNNIPMLGSCCIWNGTGCEDAPYTTSCWDDMKEPPEGAFFCDDYNARTDPDLCNEIAGDPYYMPCEWDTTKKECRFAFDNMFMGPPPGPGGFGFEDIGSKQNCEAAGGIWNSEKWTDPSGAVYTDEWCDMAFGFGKETCADQCWSCEFQADGSVWADANAARGACEGSAAGCLFFPDTHSFNKFGWCDQDWGKVGNCDQNCWDCWDQQSCDGESASLAGCKWNTDPWNDNMGWCDDSNVRTCADDCYSCWDADNCGASVSNCTWDTTAWYCKPQSSGAGGAFEVCFDGIDNDDDGFFDCADPSCFSDSFCGGATAFGVDCLSIDEDTGGQTACENESLLGYNCTWIVDPWGNEWCDMPGADCWLFDDNETGCDASADCTYKNMSTIKGMGAESFCEVNWTKMDNASCWQHWDNDTCVANAGDGCVWMEDPWCQDNPDDPWCAQVDNPGWCDNEIFSCFQYGDDQTGCDENALCNWTQDFFNPDWGWCDPVCFTRDSATCEDDVNATAGICEQFDATDMGWCEPTTMNTMKGCWEYDITVCEPVNNATCSWIDDPFGGFCADNFMFQMIGNMDMSPPMELVVDTVDRGIGNETWDITAIAIKDDPNTVSFGIGVVNMSNAAVCDKFGLGTAPGNKTTKFYWYVDANGNYTNSCTPDDNSSFAGFDFKFKYEASMNTSTGVFTETKVAYKCVSGNWSASKIKLTAMPETMCRMFDAGVLAVAKDDLEKLKVLELFDETAQMRIYVSTANENGTASDPFDTLGPIWYTPGSADFKFEDCMGFTDQDGDGLLPEKDPDCTDFLQKGYIDSEHGLECKDGQDNDGNNLADCADPGCQYDLNYCTPPDSDTTAPKITWLKVDVYTDGVFIDLNTNEPTNATVVFYKNDSFCNNISNATMVLDPKQNNSLGLGLDSDDYDLWHGIPLDNIYFAESGIDYTIAKNTTYFYKVKVEDKAGLQAVSACTNFTTAINETNFTIGFTLPPPGDDDTALMGMLNVQFDWDGDGIFTDNQTGDTGQRMNSSKGKNVNLKFTNPNATKKWCVDFIGADFRKAQSLNITDAFVVGDTGDADTLVGMKSDKWEEMAQKLGVDYISICLPGNMSSYTDGTLIHCPDNTTDVSYAQGCRNVNMSHVNCTVITANETRCDIPTTIGFTVFAEQAAVIASTTTTTTSGGGGGGGGGSGDAVEVTLSQVDAGTTAVASFDIEDTGYLSEISLFPNAVAFNVKVSVEKKDEKPSYLPEPAGIALTYLKIKKSGITDHQLDKATIRFQVPISWLKEKNIAQNSVMMRHEEGIGWSDLETDFLTEDGSNAYYEAETSSFSYFVITGDEGSGYTEPEVPATIAPPVTEAPPATEAPVETEAPPVAPPVKEIVEEMPTVEVEKEGGIPTALIIGVVVVIAAAVVIVLKKEEIMGRLK